MDTTITTDQMDTIIKKIDRDTSIEDIELIINCEHLTELTIDSNDLITDDMIISMSKKCSQLTRFYIVGCYKNVSVSGINNVFENCKKLTHLVISNMIYVTKESIEAILINCKCLKYLNILIHNNYLCQHVMKIGRNCLSLRVLELHYYNIGLTDMNIITRSCKNSNPYLNVIIKKVEYKNNQLLT